MSLIERLEIISYESMTRAKRCLTALERLEKKRMESIQVCKTREKKPPECIYPLAKYHWASTRIKV